MFDFIERKKLRKKYNINENTKLLGTVGKANKQKNQKFLINVFADYHKINNNSKLMIIGDGELSKELDDYILKKHCSENIIRIKSVGSTEKYYSCFDFFLLPSLYEGLPVSAIEAQASGVPTLLSNTIDETTKYIDNVKFLSIISGTNSWIKAIQVSKCDDRKINVNNQYNIDVEYKNLYRYYKGQLMGGH